jgi:hypothetical protein
MAHLLNHNKRKGYLQNGLGSEARANARLRAREVLKEFQATSNPGGKFVLIF